METKQAIISVNMGILADIAWRESTSLDYYYYCRYSWVRICCCVLVVVEQICL